MKKSNLTSKSIDSDWPQAPGFWAWATALGTFSVIVLLWFFTVGTVLNVREWKAQIQADFREFQKISNDAWDVLMAIANQQRHDHIASSIHSIFERHKRPKRGYDQPQCRRCAQQARGCPPGPPGPNGPKGFPGFAGEPGEDGRNGAPGLALVFEQETPGCILCPSGPQGNPGPPGRPGVKGDSGSKGARGLDGAKDEFTRRVGLPGDPGPPGQPGSVGPLGDAGADAERPIGKQGPPGMRGRVGQSGEPGLFGISGEPGKTGDPGPPGKRGPTGLAGESGIPGPPGEPGKSGQDGLYCECPKREAFGSQPSGYDSMEQNGASAGRPVGANGRGANRPANPFRNRPSAAPPSFNQRRNGAVDYGAESSYQTNGQQLGATNPNAYALGHSGMAVAAARNHQPLGPKKTKRKRPVETRVEETDEFDGGYKKEDEKPTRPPNHHTFAVDYEDQPIDLRKYKNTADEFNAVQKRKRKVRVSKKNIV